MRHGIKSELIRRSCYKPYKSLGSCTPSFKLPRFSLHFSLPLTYLWGMESLVDRVIHAAQELWSKPADEVYLLWRPDLNFAEVSTWVDESDTGLGHMSQRAQIQPGNKADALTEVYANELLMTLLDQLEGALRRKRLAARVDAQANRLAFN